MKTNLTYKYQLIAELLSVLRTDGYSIGVDKHLQIQTLLQQLPDDTEADDLRLLFVPLIAQSPEQQARLYELFDECAKRMASIEPLVSSQTTSGKTPKTPPKKYYWWAVATSIAILWLISGIVYFKSSTPKDKTVQIDTPTPKDTTVKIDTPTPKGTTVKIDTFVPNKKIPFPNHLESYNIEISPTQAWLAQYWAMVRWLLWAVLTAILLGIWRYRVWRRRKLVAQQSHNDKPPYIWNINLDDIEPILRNHHLDRITQLFRQRSLGEVQKLHIEKTINATIEQGGLLKTVYQQQTKPSDYLLLIDKQSVRNHRAQLFDTVYQLFKAQEVEIVRFFFDSDVRVCYNENYPHGIALADLQQRYYQSRLLVVGTGAQLLSPMSGKVAVWTTVFQQWKERGLFSPKPLKSWGYDERQLATLFTTLPATLQSLGFWVQELEAGEDAHFERWREKIEDAHNAPIAPKENDPLPILYLFFERDLLRWVAACAIYPALHWDLTLWLGQQIGVFENAKNPQTPFPELATFDNLVQVCRLAWFVRGEMPDPTRKALLDWLEDEEPDLLAFLRGAIAAELQKNQPPRDSAAWDEFRLNVAFNEWLATNDPQRKKQLEQEIADLLARGIKPDFTVIKYLKQPRTQLDFLVPDAWKKYIYPSGFAALGWLRDWKDLGWIALIWLLGCVALFFPYSFKASQCADNKIVMFEHNNKKLYFCLGNPLSSLAYQEALVFRLFEKQRLDSLALYLDKGQTFYLNQHILADSNARKDTAVQRLLRERDQNFAVQYYHLAEYFFNKNKKDSSCFYLEKAYAMDSLDNDINTALQKVCNKKDILLATDFEPYKDNANNLYGFLHAQTRQSLITPQYDSVYYFREGLAAVRKLGKWGFINLKNNFEIKPMYDNVARVFYNGFATVEVGDSTFYIDKKGNRVDRFFFDMVFVKGGTFQMGCTPEQGDDCADDEKPAHRITLSDFYISKYEVTQKQWREVMGTNPSYFKDCDNCPIELVSWNDVQTFIAKLNEANAKKGIKGRYSLPTEAQWEYAARGGQLSKGYKYSGSNNLGEVAWYYDNSGRKTHAVGTKKPNELGLYDMSGNVWEWCSDWYGSKTYSNPNRNLQRDPIGAVEGTHRVFRGGSWGDYALHCRPSIRNNNTPTLSFYDLGFRLFWLPF